MDRFTIMRSFVAVARCESYAVAARNLTISRALISRHVLDLERQVGIRLLNRTTRSVTLTEPGARYLAFCTRILSEIAGRDAQMSGVSENAEGDLSVVSPKWIGSLDLGNAVSSFAVDNPRIHVRLELGGLSERTYSFIDEGYDIAFHTKNLKDSSIRVRKIAPLHFALCAAPSYLSRCGVPATPLEIARHECLVHVSDPVWHFNQGSLRHHIEPQRVAFSSNTYLILQKAAIRGMGVAVLPVRSVYPEIKSGRLQVILADFPLPVRPLYAAYAPGRQVGRMANTFVDFIAEWFRRYPTLAGNGRESPIRSSSQDPDPLPERSLKLR